MRIQQLLMAATSGLILSIGSASVISAQDPPPCTYETCALRVKYGVLGTSIVQGAQEDHLASVAFFPPTLPQLAERSDSAAIFYSAFRARQNRGMVLTFIGLIGIAVGGALVDTNDDSSWLAVMPGLAVTFAGVQQLNSGRERLSRAVWEYNRTLSPP
jgi:hypothetical protein